MVGSLVTVSEVVPLRILLAEDNPGDIEILEHILTGMAIELRHTASLKELEQQGKIWDPDVVLLDLHLEDSQDFMVTARTVVTLFPHVPILAFTSLDDETFALRALQAGLSSYLIKGTLSGAGLMRAIKEAQARKRSQHLSVSPTLNQENLRSVVQAAVNSALQESEESKDSEDPFSKAMIALVISLILLLLGGIGAWGYYRIHQVRDAPDPIEEVQKDKADALFQEFQQLREEHLELRVRWENQGKTGPRPEKPVRLLQLEQELSR